ncbi:protein kinase domain-containing protein [Kitasatospora viridis]|uniref:Serine/threonine protein kinase n=1 Tax=Kitasatospora viridis TaxID=281105 RepID=A0A561UNC7_9ACTN|nr:serine/threonine-protein kinase [Kitasatospora viridis]TWG00861.1 serine/threonine protein kinase [Kitasatospora viridis]
MPIQPLESADPEAVGPYRLLARLGAGGMGRVYLARSTGGRTVAIKVVRPELAEDQEFRERFRREVAAAQAVSGVYTAPVVDADRDGPVPWLATAYVLGPSLTEAVQAHGPLPVGAVRALGAGLAEALAAVHRAGLVHRDLKPSNVLLAADGPRLIDFGIARALEGGGLTGTGIVVGSPGFMCPEQASGAVTGPAGDVFSLGSVLVFAATGAGPFSQDTDSAAALLYRVIHDQPALDGVPEELLPTLAACLAKDPVDRPTTAELAELLGGRGPLRSGWLPAAVASDIATHAATVLDMETPARGSAAAGHPPTEVNGHGEGTVRLAAARTVPAPAAAAPTAPATSRRMLLAGGGAALVAALGGTVWALSRGGTPHPGPAPLPARSSGAPSPARTHAPGSPPFPLWTHDIPGAMASLTPLCQGDAVYFYGPGGVYALAMTDGTVRWSKPDQGTLGLAATASGVVYNGTDLVEVDPASGNVLWKFDATPKAGATEQLGPDQILAGDDRAVYGLCHFSALDSAGDIRPDVTPVPGVFAVSRQDGSLLWSQHRSPDADTDVQAVLTKDLLLYTDTKKNLVARSTGTGAQLWFVDTDSQGVYQPGLDGDRLYCSSSGSGLQAVTLATQHQAWAKSAPQGSKDLWYSAPAVADGVVYTVLGGTTMPQYGATPTAGPTVIAYRAADGTELWRLPLPNEVSMDCTPVLVQGTLFVSTNTKGFYAIDTKARKILWIYQADATIDLAWAFATDGRTLVAVQDTKVVALPPV